MDGPEGRRETQVIGKPVRVTVLLVVILLAGVLITATSPVAAQEADGQIALPKGAAPEINEGSLYSGPYEATVDGDLIYGGDVVYRCEELPAFASLARQEEPRTAGSAQEEASFEEAIGLCAKAGFAPEKGTVPGTPSVPGTAALPKTGGLALPSIPFLVATAVLAAGSCSAFMVGCRRTTSSRVW